MKKTWIQFAWIVVVFVAFWALPVGNERLGAAVDEALALAHSYARQHVLLCLVPAFFIAGAMGTFLSKQSVMKYLGPQAGKLIAYGVASVSGSILAVCSCTAMPLFAGIYRMGAGLGPAVAFLYAAPAINVLAVILTARVLGLELGVARAVGAMVFSVVLGLLMSVIFRDEKPSQPAPGFSETDGGHQRPLWQNGLFFAAMVGFLVFANWPAAAEVGGVWAAVASAKWYLTGAALLVLGWILVRWFRARDLKDWCRESWGFARQILPLLLIGILVAGFLLGRPREEGLVPSAWVAGAVGGNSLKANAFASVAGALMYFATLTEVPILDGLIGAGMGKGPALALLLAGPSLSLPNILVIRSIIGTKKTAVYALLVVALATAAGMIYGAMFPS